MKTLIFAAFSMLSVSAYATSLSKEIERFVVDINVNVSPSSVRCSNLGYDAAELKIDVPDLDWAAKYNHRSRGEGQPCMTSFRCEELDEAARFVELGAGVRPVPLTIIHSEKATVSSGKCSRWIQEDLSMVVNGVTFRHTRTGVSIQSTEEVCRAIFK